MRSVREISKRGLQCCIDQVNASRVKFDIPVNTNNILLCDIFSKNEQLHRARVLYARRLLTIVRIARAVGVTGNQDRPRTNQNARSILWHSGKQYVIAIVAVRTVSKIYAYRIKKGFSTSAPLIRVWSANYIG